MDRHEQTDEAAAWAAETLYQLDAIAGAALNRLTTLAANPPEGPGAFVALREVIRHLGVADTLHPEAAAGSALAASVQARLSTAEAVGVELVRALTAAADRELDRGGNDEADPVVRLKDIAHGTGVLPPFDKPLAVAFVRGLPASHPLKTIAPLDDGTNSGNPLVVLGNIGAAWYRLSTIKSMTAKVATWRREQEAERERLRKLDEEQREAAFARSPAGQAARLRELEQQLGVGAKK